MRNSVHSLKMANQRYVEELSHTGLMYSQITLEGFCGGFYVETSVGFCEETCGMWTDLSLLSSSHP